MVVEEAPVDPQAEAATPTSITANSAPIILRPSRTTTTNAYLALLVSISLVHVQIRAWPRRLRISNAVVVAPDSVRWPVVADRTGGIGSVLVPSRRVGAMSSTRLVARDDPDRHPLPGGGSLRSR